MKFNCGTSEQRRRQAARDHWCTWHLWFAWYPVRVDDNDCRWLERVYRKADNIHGGGLFKEFTPYDFSYRSL